MLVTKEKISVIIIAGNEEANIKECLESVSWADEIILVDSLSHDRTIEIAKLFTNDIFVKKWEGYTVQRKYAISKTKNNWIFSIDADERVSPELKDEIINTLESPNGFSGYEIPRRNYFLNKNIKSCFWYPDYQLRLFRKDRVEVTNRKVHEGYIVNGTVAKLNFDLIHLTHQTLTQVVAKINLYSSLDAEERVNEKDIKWFNLVLNPTAAFLNHFISRKGYKDGIYGFMISALHAITTLLTYMKIWELQNNNKHQ